MILSKENLDILKQNIIEAFYDVPYPKSSIAPHECEECREIRETFAGKNWKNIESKILEENYGIIPLFSPEAFHYFLPAYMVYSLENTRENYLNEVFEFTVYTLVPSKDIKENPSYWIERFRSFTPDQWNLIFEFLDAAEETKEFEHINIERGKKRLKIFVEPNLKL
jgi:hypothetical protein